MDRADNSFNINTYGNLTTSLNVYAYVVCVHEFDNPSTECIKRRGSPKLSFDKRKEIAAAL